MVTWAVVKSIAKKIPWQLWGLSGVLIAFWAWGTWNRSQGRDEVQNLWDDSVTRGKVIVDKLRKESEEIIIVTETKYVDRVEVIYEEGKTVVKEIPIYIPVDSTLPGGFRLLHDAATTGTAASSSEIPNAAPVSLTTATETIAENYTQCRVTAERLISLQDWTLEVCQLYNRHLPDQTVECSLPYE